MEIFCRLHLIIRLWIASVKTSLSLQFAFPFLHNGAKVVNSFANNLAAWISEAKGDND